jgi:hypothetical protein
MIPEPTKIIPENLHQENPPGTGKIANLVNPHRESQDSSLQTSTEIIQLRIPEKVFPDFQAQTSPRILEIQKATYPMAFDIIMCQDLSKWVWTKRFFGIAKNCE